MAIFVESGDAADGEEITNKTSGIQDGLKRVAGGVAANQRIDEMCLIHRDFKHFPWPKTKDFRNCRNDSSIMWAKVLSIMRADDAGLTSLFKRFRARLR